MSDLHKYIAASSHITAPLVSLVCSGILIRYLNSKPLGMQTLLDKFMIELQYAYIFMSFSCNYPLASGNVFSNQLNEPVRLILTGFIMGSLQLFFLHLAVYLVIKYLSIYHSTLLQYEIDESQLIIRVRFGLFVSAFLLVGIELIANDVHQLRPYQVLKYGIPQPDVTHDTTFSILIFLTLLLLILLQSRIEYDNIVFNEATETTLQTGLNIVVHPANWVVPRQAKINWVRFGVLGGTISVVLLFLIPQTHSQSAEFKLTVVLLHLLSFHCIMPIVYIFSYPNVKSFAITQVKSIFIRK
jgi:hypothetical protein